MRRILHTSIDSPAHDNGEITHENETLYRQRIDEHIRNTAPGHFHPNENTAMIDSLSFISVKVF